MGLRKLGREMGVWNFVWRIAEREREVPKNLRDMGRRTVRAVHSIPTDSLLNSVREWNLVPRIENFEAKGEIP